MKERLDEIGSRLRELRELNMVSSEEMAEHLNVPVGTYNCYEDGKLDIPASILIGIARKLNVDTGLLLTGEESKMSIFTITRKGEAVEVERRKQYHYQSLARKFAHKKAEPFIVTIDPRKDGPSFYSHPGQEFEYVLEGSLKITIHDNDVVLNAGDSIFFDSSYDHYMQALNDKPVKLLAVVM
ncbi:MAG: cupin domain-containing protein [Methanothrix sp.]|jgi:quercetin dioxygenase-like cupin family protein|nr:cupin domain-containing protein [Methanothrix sp.]